LQRLSCGVRTISREDCGIPIGRRAAIPTRPAARSPGQRSRRLAVVQSGAAAALGPERCVVGSIPAGGSPTRLPPPSPTLAVTGKAPCQLCFTTAHTEAVESTTRRRRPLSSTAAAAAPEPRSGRLGPAPRRQPATPPPPPLLPLEPGMEDEAKVSFHKKIPLISYHSFSNVKGLGFQEFWIHSFRIYPNNNYTTKKLGRCQDYVNPDCPCFDLYCAGVLCVHNISPSRPQPAGHPR
jgi:hypothetical protein